MHACSASRPFGASLQGAEPAGPRRVFPSALQKQLDQEAKKRSESALQSLTTYADNRGVGLKLLASMGFGGEGTGLGRNEQVHAVSATYVHQWPHI